MSNRKVSSVNLTIINRSQISTIPKYTIWFDIDNTLYSKRCKIHESMTEKILDYFKGLGLPDQKANELHKKYYKEYGLAIRGLVRHHDIDPLDYNQKCDSALPLEDLLSPDEEVRQILLDIDRSKARVWCLTNAYKTHALRVLKILNLEDLVEAVVSCDYTNLEFHCKPEPEFFEEAIECLTSTVLSKIDEGSSSKETLRKIISDRSNQLLVDDSCLNIIGASKFGFGSRVFFDEREEDEIEGIEKDEDEDEDEKKRKKRKKEEEEEEEERDSKSIEENDSLLLRNNSEIGLKDVLVDLSYETVHRLDHLRRLEVWKTLFVQK